MKRYLPFVIIFAVAAIACSSFWWFTEGDRTDSAGGPITVTASIPNSKDAFPPRRVTDEAQDVTFRIPKLDADKLNSLKAKEKRNIPFTLTIQ